MAHNNEYRSAPPVMRVFLSSTFSDMENERNYFNEVLSPKISRACADRGVSFFSVDLRWGITAEEQLDGKVLPICLGEIDKCRPYFIGILGNRYGSVMETVSEQNSKNIPWLLGKEGRSITEIEMLYAVLDYDDNERNTSNSAFYMRSAELSAKWYPNQGTEDERLSALKKRIRNDDKVIYSDYDSLEEFGECIMRDVMSWLDKEFPAPDKVKEVRRAWYNSELLRNYIENPAMDSFLYTYVEESDCPLLLYGEGARGKSAFLTDWQPRNGKKILINCGADDDYLYWPNVASSIIDELNDIDPRCNYPDGFLYLATSKDNGLFFDTDKELEHFRIAFLDWLAKLHLTERVYVVINDLDLLDDENSRLLAWLPSSPTGKLRFICSTNDGEVVGNAEILGWNCKKMPRFSGENAKAFVDGLLHSYGKNLSDSQMKSLLSSVESTYPGQLRFAVTFLINHGRFSNLDGFCKDIAEFKEISDIYKYAYDYISSAYSEREKKTARTVFAMLDAAKISLKENQCFLLAEKLNGTTTIEWARVHSLFEQFGVVKGDYWNLRDKELKRFAGVLISDEEKNAVNELMGDYMLQLLAEENNGKQSRDNGVYAAAALHHYQKGMCTEKLLCALKERDVLFPLSGMNWHLVRVAWMSLLLDTEYDLPKHLFEIINRYKDDDRRIAEKTATLFYDLEMKEHIAAACALLDTDYVGSGTEFHLASLSDEFKTVYNKMVVLKQSGDYRRLYAEISSLLEEEREYSPFEKSKLLSIKCTCEGLLHLDSFIDSVSEYYYTAVKSGNTNEMMKALLMRSEAIFRSKKYKEAIKDTEKLIRFALYTGELNQYLVAYDIQGMCKYSIGEYDEAIRIFDRMIACWKKLGSYVDVGNSMINRSTAYHLKGDTEKALESLKEFYDGIKDDESLEAISLDVLGKMGLYSMLLGDEETAEEYLLLTAKKSAAIKREATLIKARNNLIDLYKKQGYFLKAVALYEQQMELYWTRQEYASLLKALDKAKALLHRNKHEAQAEKLMSYWQKRFSSQEGGRKYFDEHFGKVSFDAIGVERLKEQIAIAKSENDIPKMASIYVKLALELKEAKRAESGAAFLEAAVLYRNAGNEAKSLSCLEDALILCFSDGKIVNNGVYQGVIELVKGTSLEEVATLWESLGSCFSDNAVGFDALLKQLVSHSSAFGKTVAFCVADMNKKILEICSVDSVAYVIDALPQKYKEDVLDVIDREMLKDMDSRISFLMQDYASPKAEKLLTFYEKAILIMEKTGNADSAALAGNIALIFRRRKDKEKTLRYHSMSSAKYKELGKNEDCLIEIMNMATAYKEFGDMDGAIDRLRQGIKEAERMGERKLGASIAGNLAAYLQGKRGDGIHEEIMSCFAIEEGFFRQSDYKRDLAVSLINQSIYHVKRGEFRAAKPKLDEVMGIAQSYEFREFYRTLATLDSMIKKGLSEEEAPTAEEENKETLFVKKLLEKTGVYRLSGFEVKDGECHAVCHPQREDVSAAEQLHLAFGTETPCSMSVGIIFYPKFYQSDAAPEIQKYAAWWNEKGSYQLAFNEKERKLYLSLAIQTASFSALAEQFRKLISLWERDKSNVLSLSMCMSGFEDAKRIKEKLC